MNWPVAKDISKILINCGKEIIPEIRKLLNSNDADWKYYCLAFIVCELPKEIIEYLRMELEQIAFNPSEYELFFELNVTEAKNILELIK